MDLTKLSDLSLKIKLKKLTIVTDPEKKADAEVAIVTAGVPDKTMYDEYALVIEGPGEYEKNGIYIKGEKVGEGIAYTIIDGTSKIHFAESTALEKFKEEDIEVLIVKAVAKVDESTLSSFSGSIVAVYGNPEFIQISPEVAKHTNKITSKTREEFAGSIVILDA